MRGLSSLCRSGWHLSTGVDSVGGTGCLGMLQMGLPYWLFAKSVKQIPGHEATGIVILEPILVPLWVYIAWGT